MNYSFTHQPDILPFEGEDWVTKYDVFSYLEGVPLCGSADIYMTVNNPNMEEGYVSDIEITNNFIEVDVTALMCRIADILSDMPTLRFTHKEYCDFVKEATGLLEEYIEKSAWESPSF